MSDPVRVVLVGVGGFGLVHAARIATLQAAGEVRLVGAVDPFHAEAPDVIAGTPVFPDLTAALGTVGPVDIVVVAAPIGDHVRLAEQALTGGADVLLEKPPVADYADFVRLLAAERASGRVVQVGFQSLGSPAARWFAEDAFGIGAVVGVTATGAWSRTVGYWNRSAWAGRRSLHGQPVVDGVLTNPLAHATATALAVAGCRTAEEVASVEVDLYRANAIDADDTSAVRIRTSAGLTVVGAFTLCAPDQSDPVIRVRGTRGTARYAYTADRLEVEVDGTTRTVDLPREDLLENLIAFRRSGTALLVPLAGTGAFMRVLDEVARAGEPVRIDPRAIEWSGEGSDRRAAVIGVTDALERVTETGRTFTELGVDWAHPGRDTVLVRGRIGEREVLAYRDGAGTIPMSTPRPYLHPVRTLAGVVVSATHPADHDWHTGVGLAIPDVNGTNFWGGGTYAAEHGYVHHDDHGTLVGDPPDVDPSGFEQRLDWVARSGRTELTEQRSVGWTRVAPTGWRLVLSTVLTAARPVVIGSPGSKGRVGGGYGGFFWRFPRCEDVEVFTATARGEAAVHGSVAPWVAWSADFSAGPGVGGPATVVVVATDATRHREPWFVRVDGYPGLGSALAWDTPVSLPAGASLARRFEVLVADGRLDHAAVQAALAG